MDKEKLRLLDKINYGVLVLFIVLNIIAKGFIDKRWLMAMIGFCLVASFVLEYFIKRK